MSEPADSRPSSRGSGSGRGALFALAALALGAVPAALWWARARPAHTLALPVVLDPDGPVGAFVGRLEGPRGDALVARLAPMHSEAARQDFEAHALAERFGLEPGRPYRLTLRWEHPGEAAVDAALHLGSVAVIDSAGPALVPILGSPGGDAASAAVRGDPVRTVFSAPSGTLGPGEEVDWILWGREPRPGSGLDGVRIVGLLPAGSASEALAAEVGFAGPLALAPADVRQSELVLPVARLDRGGKSAAGRTSEAPDDELGSGGEADAGH